MLSKKPMAALADQGTFSGEQDGAGIRRRDLPCGRPQQEPQLEEVAEEDISRTIKIKLCILLAA
ncbi:hypothetical protein FJ970_30495 [Mesorhizobium sp. B2-1-8]|uniref:hypothetical protein n=1 Tax=Mesorhizobium sp. B2-1-8 TaxID=2589967 RepID=UPI00116E9B44|nr:hypothetical protein [Mesorhizobium sp. B2-1-8]UCI19286.1 hypothetical protein FJ970_30495 [Mesorhizobium sp. B2-1-8]